MKLFERWKKKKCVKEEPQPSLNPSPEISPVEKCSDVKTAERKRNRWDHIQWK